MKLAYREFGQGQPLIILHGLFGQSDNWNTLAKLLGEQGFNVFAVDQRNHGLSPQSEDWNYEVMAADLKEFIDEHSLKDPILLGHSMGGKTVMFFEFKFPNIASKIIIADISPRAYEPHHQQVLSALNAVDFSIIKTRKEAEAKLNEHIKDFGTKQFLLKNIYWKDAENNIMDWRFNLKVINKNYNNIGLAVPEFKSNTPCLVIKGTKSNYITDKDLNDFKARFLNCSITSIEAGHWVHAEKPKEFFEVVLNFIR
ncbi:MAG: alpha/beta fold hydrolase [Bacteroidetes bacterium]|nr:alpha/beta fold hydrolase [Bacteroidota bacterium]